MALTITDVAAVREAGSLKDPASAPGAASNKQIQQAIKQAQQGMVLWLTKATYDLVKDYDSTALSDATKDLNGYTKADQLNAFRQAES
jgi:hypothetical protein